MIGKIVDYKKQDKHLYMPKGEPVLVEVPNMKFLMVDGSGDPNQNPEFQEAVELLYGLAYTIKMSKKKAKEPPGYFDYVVPPLEGLWWINGGDFSFEQRNNWKYTLMIRLPDFVITGVFEWACVEFEKKKPGIEVEKARFEEFEEGSCVQVMHTGPYATEPETMKKIESFMNSHSLRDLVGIGGKHHEIYLSDPRKTEAEKMKTVLRHPVTRGK